MGHNNACAKAQRPGCKCKGCGGSEHGWQGCLDMARDPGARRRRREVCEGQLRTHPGSTRLRNNAGNRAAVTDLARVDIADWLAEQASDDVLKSRPPTPTELPDAAHPTAVQQVETLAETMAKETWPKIAAALERERDIPGTANQVKRDLAAHTWCDLFVGMVMAIEAAQGALQDIPDTAKKDVKETILRSSMRDNREHVTAVVVDIVLDRVWAAFKATMFAQVPLLAIIGRGEAIRNLRILAVFTCPAPGDHREVREHALKPLGDEARRILTDQTKARLRELFADWRL